MNTSQILNYSKEVLNNMPSSWLKLTTHRLDIYNESLAKTQFLNAFKALYATKSADPIALSKLPTAYDYIRLGHPLSCILEWVIAETNNIKAENVISFDSNTMPILAILRKNLALKKDTLILYSDVLPPHFNDTILKKVYGYNFTLKKIADVNNIPEFNGSTIFISQEKEINITVPTTSKINFYISIYKEVGSVLIVNNTEESYISDIQHVRRRETIAMTPANSLTLLKLLTKQTTSADTISSKNNTKTVLDAIKSYTKTNTKPLIASSGLSIQYAILMGLIDDAIENNKGKAIKIIVPPNCYGGTNDQARRIAASITNVTIVDLPVDGDNNMVKSINTVLDKIAKEDAVPYIIAEIPTNPRVEVPNLKNLKDVLIKERKTNKDKIAISPVFILDQTFCPNINFSSENEILSPIKTISFTSASKFPSGGLCTAGYCVANKKAVHLLNKIETHLKICDNEATAFQIKILAKQLPSMLQRINDAYLNTREFVSFIKSALPEAKINFVSEELAQKGFTPSVFSLDLPTKGNTAEEKETYKRELNLKLISLMITEIPDESKFCVSYGQLSGCYWTIPATSTQGTTKEGDKDYIVRVSLSPKINLNLHKKTFLKFVEKI